VQRFALPKQVSEFPTIVLVTRDQQRRGHGPNAILIESVRFSIAEAQAQEQIGGRSW
jgi:hypothetical protein